MNQWTASMIENLVFYICVMLCFFFLFGFLSGGLKVIL
jgi:hypothetical protein